MKKLFIGLFAVISFYSCEKTEFTGQGDIVTRTLELAVVQRFSSQGSFDIFIKQGATQEIIAVGQSNIIDRLITSVDNGRWDIKLKSGNYTDFTLTVTITSPNIEEMIIDGSGDIFVDDYATSTLRLRSRGSGDIIVSEPLNITNRLQLVAEASGDISINALTCQNLAVDVEGSGDVDIAGSSQDALYYVDGSGDVMAFGMTSQTATATNKGSGDIELSVEDQLDVNITASGNIFYRGNPNITQDITGSGKLVNRN